MDTTENKEISGSVKDIADIISVDDVADVNDNCCMVLCEQMFMHGSCVESNTTSGLTVWKLYSALGNNDEEYNSVRRKTL